LPPDPKALAGANGALPDRRIQAPPDRRNAFGMLHLQCPRQPLLPLMLFALDLVPGCEPESSTPS